jgi:hypothetical protein
VDPVALLVRAGTLGRHCAKSSRRSRGGLPHPASHEAATSFQIHRCPGPSPSSAPSIAKAQKCLHRRPPPARRPPPTLLIDVGSLRVPTITPDISRTEVLAALNAPDTAAIFVRRDRGECVTLMARAAADRIDGIISPGGGGGTAAMRALPIDFQKLMVSTLRAVKSRPTSAPPTSG